MTLNLTRLLEAFSIENGSPLIRAIRDSLFPEPPGPVSSSPIEESNIEGTLSPDSTSY